MEESYAASQRIPAHLADDFGYMSHVEERQRQMMGDKIMEITPPETWRLFRWKMRTRRDYNTYNYGGPPDMIYETKMEVGTVRTEPFIVTEYLSAHDSPPWPPPQRRHAPPFRPPLNFPPITGESRPIAAGVLIALSIITALLLQIA